MPAGGFLMWWLPGWSVGSAEEVIVDPGDPTDYGDESPMLVHPFYSDAFAGINPVHYGGSFVAKMPITNLGESDMSLVARTTNVAPSSTEMRCYYGVVRRIRAVIIPHIDVTPNATYRVTLAMSDAALSNGSHVYRSAILPIWPAGVTREQMFGRRTPIEHLVNDLESDVMALYHRVEIFDSGNSRGYLTIPRLVAGDVYQFPHGMTVGAASKSNDGSSSWRSEGGSTQHQVRYKERTQSFEISRLEEAEAFGVLEDMEWRLGTTGQVYFFFRHHDVYGWKRNFLATLRDVPASEWPWATEVRKRYELTEAL